MIKLFCGNMSVRYIDCAFLSSHILVLNKSSLLIYWSFKKFLAENKYDI